MTDTSKSYSSDQVIFIAGSVTADEVGSDNFLKMTKASPAYLTKVGVRGDIVFNKQRNRLWTVDVTLLATSATNKMFNEMWLADQAKPNGLFFALTVRDRGGNDLHTCEAGKLVACPDPSWGKEVGELTWQFAGGFDMNFGGYA